VTLATNFAGRKTVAVVFAGIVVFKTNRSPSRRHSLRILPRTES
jgi:hypothetical protein